MIKNGVTPAVMTFVDETNRYITDDVLNAISHSHDVDQDYINDLCQDFTSAVQAMQTQTEEIEVHDTSRLAATEAH